MTAGARREQLLQTARAEFLRSGFGGTTVRDITDAAGVNTALLYRHFGSKEELFDAAVAGPLEDALADVVSRAREASAYIGRPDVQRAATARTVERLLVVMGEITPLLGIVLFSERGAAFHAEHLAPAVARIAQAADLARAPAGHRPYDPDLIATMLVGTCFWHGLREVFEGVPGDHERLAREFTDLLFDGIVPR
jgi:AcrR family transcriptional regulator